MYASGAIRPEKSYSLGLLGHEQGQFEVVKAKSMIIEPVRIRQETHMLNRVFCLVQALLYKTLEFGSQWIEKRALTSHTAHQLKASFKIRWCFAYMSSHQVLQIGVRSIFEDQKECIADSIHFAASGRLFEGCNGLGLHIRGVRW